uniref:Uncharacterized protein n=1 Tax=Candidatus Kentrum sp. LFY TaxID=2126342 RepID=A0A450UA57_9GAMM|nr:MAG: hypothetical protein BECKLFY1418A_GA0070994_100617 [Candidatus Kentron sp. LFY]
MIPCPSAGIAVWPKPIVYFPLSLANVSSSAKHRFCFTDANSCCVGSSTGFAKYAQVVSIASGEIMMHTERSTFL